MMGESTLPPNLNCEGRYLTCTLEGPRSVHTSNYPFLYSSITSKNPLSLSFLDDKLEIIIDEISNTVLVLQLINLDVNIVNALRRILIAEIPTVAVETVHIWQNTGVIQDEILAHRLGLIPMKIDPDLISEKKEYEEFTDNNSVKFKLHIKCNTPDKIVSVFARDMIWQPLSEKQYEMFKNNPPQPVEPDILITKLNTNQVILLSQLATCQFQELEVEVYCQKGIGKTHAKWSPVATAYYRLMPIINLASDLISTTEANELKNICPSGVFDVEDGISIVRNPRLCTTCRVCIERFPNKVVLLKDKQHFIFTIESTGCITPWNLFLKAVDILKFKSVKILKNISLIKKI